ncbi:MAG: ubiquinone/menaquinone biosynthesis C-methylase UbiE [Myxococcota bacterium]|jgi:ubiquinone/menaquinone biosynthesis C-methylase UbiE
MELRTDIDVLDELGPWVGLSVVDVGSGRGVLARGLVALGATVLAVEPDAAQRDVAETEQPVDGLRLVAGFGTALPAADASQDAVIFNRSLHHIPILQMDAALREGLRVLCPGGRLLVLEPDPDGQMSMVMAPFHDEREVRGAAQAALDRLTLPSTEASYLRGYAFPDLPSFRARMAASTVIDADQGGLASALVTQRFSAGFDPTGEGEERYRFTNPIRLRIFTAR